MFPTRLHEFTSPRIMPEVVFQTMHSLTQRFSVTSAIFILSLLVLYYLYRFLNSQRSNPPIFFCRSDSPARLLPEDEPEIGARAGREHLHQII